MGTLKGHKIEEAEHEATGAGHADAVRAVMRRRTVVGGLVGLGALLTVLAILAVWVSRQVLETDQWVDTSSQLLEEPAIQSAVSGYLVDQLYANVDVAGQLRSALPPRADVLAAPVASALRRGVEDVADRALDRPRVQQGWENANRKAHALLVKVIDGEGNLVSAKEGVVTLDLRALLQELAGRTGLGAKAAAKLPADAASIVIVQSDQLGLVQDVGGALKPLALVLVLLSLGCFIAAVALAGDRRREAVRASGWAFIAAGALALVVRNVAGDAVVGELAKTAAVKPAVQSVWTISTSLLTGVAWATIAYGALAVAGAWLVGPTRAATALRRALAPGLRDPLTAYGATAAIVLIVTLWAPTEGTRRLVPWLLLVALFVAGVEAVRRRTRRDFPDAVHWQKPGLVSSIEQRLSGAPRKPTAPSAQPAPAESSVARLERLDRLHRDGVLSDDEFAIAKQQALTSA